MFSKLTFVEVRLGRNNGFGEAVVIFRIASSARLEVVSCGT